MSVNQKIKIKLKSFDSRILERAASEVILAVKRTGADVNGPVPLPRLIRRFTVNRSPHVNKKSREQFEIRTHKRLIIIPYPVAQTVDALKKVNLPAGVDVEIKLVSA
jgi:small subunit ribosomal protein S10